MSDLVNEIELDLAVVLDQLADVKGDIESIQDKMTRVVQTPDNAFVQSALREFHYVLSHALRTNGVESFNHVTMSGDWYAASPEAAEKMLSRLRAAYEKSD
jgi:hypothetical protein